MKIEDYLRNHAKHYPDKTAIVCNNKSYSYGQLFELVKQRSENIHSANAKVVPFRTTQNIDFFVEYFSIHLAGAVAVPLSQDSSEALFNSVKDSLNDCCLPEDSADILYTTGTTGEPKGVIISHQAMISNAENLIDAQHYTSDLTFIIAGPLNHIGSLSKIYPVIMLGATLYILEGMKDINAFFEAIAHSGTRIATFLVPASIRILIQFSADRLKQCAEKIDFIETGAAPISHSEMCKLCSLLPNSRLYNTYASTETGIISTYNFNDGICLTDCVGQIMKNSSVDISASGTIICKGKTLMSGYVKEAKLTKAVLHDGALYTHDLGFFNEDNMLHIIGRSDDVINVGGFKVAPTEVEKATLLMESIEDCICIAVDHPIVGKVLKLLFIKKEGSMIDKHDIATFLKSQLEGYKVPFLYQCVKEIKRTFNGKLDRKAYYTDSDY